MKSTVYCLPTIVAAAAFLAGCGGSQPPIGAPGAIPQTTNYKVIYSFGPSPDGSYPTASLIDLGGTLYGTTAGGGSDSCHSYPYSPYSGCGTVFKIAASGTEKVLYRFGTPPDGSVPYASLLDVGGTLYGTTVYGGSYTCGYNSEPFTCGTIFSITTSGAEKVLHSFGQASDGEYPLAGLIKVKRLLYGTTSGGGANYCAPYRYNIRCGTVFVTTPGGAEGSLYSFGPGTRRPNTPLGSLINAGGTLYGTTRYGGKHEVGTVFSIPLHGTLKVLHEFSGTDGAAPLAGLTEVNDILYGTTSSGGVLGSGTVFSVTSGGTEKVLHNFGAGSDGSGPVAGLIDVNGTFYGTTKSGGAYGGGTVFSVTTSGTEKVLHSFGGSNSDGFSPYAGLTDLNGALYGSTYRGGTHGYGTVFALTP